MKLWDLIKKQFSIVENQDGKSIEVSIFEAKYEFPCSSDKCLVRAGCTQACEKIEMDKDKLKDLFEKYECCPDCGGERFMEGPSGGMSQNVKCSGCGHWFNLALPVFIERIHISSDGRFYE